MDICPRYHISEIPTVTTCSSLVCHDKKKGSMSAPTFAPGSSGTVPESESGQHAEESGWAHAWLKVFISGRVSPSTKQSDQMIPRLSSITLVMPGDFWLLSLRMEG
ncbi:uncharacterized protein RAG0_14993 [Rhynchosporium agropyri]|uniref:Uncharacterized protein n=1 Tax=Rhynchosporium agropyri TaxID=914238 RepID=A0A1E1LJ75_9HELO|nr:uncharacterized protein RAG0_14993 [Rhynchosporium agropyri]